MGGGEGAGARRRPPEQASFGEVPMPACRTAVGHATASCGARFPRAGGGPDEKMTATSAGTTPPIPFVDQYDQGRALKELETAMAEDGQGVQKPVGAAEHDDAANDPARSHTAHVLREIGLGIVSGRYPQHAILPGDAELMARFGVSRTVLREAMK